MYIYFIYTLSILYTLYMPYHITSFSNSMSTALLVFIFWLKLNTQLACCCWFFQGRQRYDLSCQNTGTNCLSHSHSKKTTLNFCIYWLINLFGLEISQTGYYLYRRDIKFELRLRWTKLFLKGLSVPCNLLMMYENRGFLNYM